MQEGARPTQTVAYVDLGSFPRFTTTLLSPLSPAEIRSRIAGRIGHRAERKATPSFTGSTSPAAFEVRVRMPMGRVGGPVLLGSVKATPDDSFVGIRIRPHFATFWVVGWTLFLSTALLLFYMETHLLLSVFVFIAGTLTSALFWWRFQYEGRLLLDLVKEECCLTPLPAAEPPTTF
ncbi:MAG: hypothetical protein IPN77_33530 [Sandaracinaceae bacterium]|nr:hypothetical protein [Sandaracinaceae bacterium]